MRRLRLLSRGVALLVLASARPLLSADTMTPFDVARLKTVAAVALSPDGQRIAYLLSVPRRVPEEDDGPAWAELHVVGRDGASRGYVTGAVTVGDIAWSKDNIRLQRGRPGLATLLMKEDRSAVAAQVKALGQRSALVEGDDGWTIRTANGCLAAHHEHTIVIREGGAEVLTAA